jgi:hypothetical protein
VLAYYDSKFVMSNADWERIEHACGWQLSAAMREDVRSATEELLYWDACKKLSVPVATIKKEIRAWKKAAEKLERKGLTNHTVGSLIAERLIKKEIGSPAAVTAPLIVACEKVLGDLERTRSIRGAFGDYDTVYSFKEREAWNLWVLRLAEVLDDAQLRPSSRKDAGGKSKSDKQSPFAVFVSELQKCLPHQCERPYADSALPTAIGRALSFGSNKTRGSD